MSQFDTKWLQDYETKRKAQSAEPQRTVCHEPLAAQEGEASHASRVHVRVISRRNRLIDPDNLCPKYFIDCLRYAELIKDDTAEQITLEVSQEKVGKGEEETVIEVFNMEQFKEAITSQEKGPK